MSHSPSDPTSGQHVITIMISLQPLHKNVPGAHETASKEITLTTQTTSQSSNSSIGRRLYELISYSSIGDHKLSGHSSNYESESKTLDLQGSQCSL